MWPRFLQRALLAALLPCAAAAQQTHDPESAARQAQQAGDDVQVHTGSSLGVDQETHLRNLLADHQFLRLEEALEKLPAEETSFYRGVLANRTNDTAASIKLLEPLVERIAASGDKEREKLARKALAEDYLRAGDWKKAAAAYERLATRLDGQLSEDERDELEMPVKLLPLVKDAPPMTVEPCEPFMMQVEKDPLGLIDVPVFVDAQPHAWMLDPTAPFNLIARSLAREVGLKVGMETATIRTLTGKPIQVHVTVIPRFTVAGRLTLRNLTVFVYEDKDYFFPASRYQVEGVLGFPAVSALGSLTITADDTIFVRPSKEIAAGEKDDRLTTGARFFLDGDRIIAALGREGATKAGDEQMYEIDAGGQQTYLTSRYYNEHDAEFAGQRMELLATPGAENQPPQPAYMAESVVLNVGDATARVHYVQVLTEPLGSAALDDVYGVLGVDALDQLGSYTFDYRTMRFGVKAR